MGKMIINNRTHLSDLEVLEYISSVVKEGRISADETYCFVTTFTNGVVVLADKTKTGTDKFIITKDKNCWI